MNTTIDLRPLIAVIGGYVDDETRDSVPTHVFVTEPFNLENACMTEAYELTAEEADELGLSLIRAAQKLRDKGDE